jgi:signal transduction histidine kinase
MSHSPAGADAHDAMRARRSIGSVLALRNWRLAWRLTALVTIPTMLGLTLAGLRVADATRSAETYSQIGRIAVLGQKVTGLAQAMEDERADAGAFIASGRPAAGLAALNRQYVITNRWTTTVRRLALPLGGGYPDQTRSSAVTILADIAELPGLRKHATQSRAPALTVINGYSAAIGGLFQVNNSIADLTGNTALITSVRTLDSLSRMADHASLQRAILGAALAEGHFGPGALAALTSAEAQQASDLASFRSSATREQSWALTATLADPLAGQARAVERRSMAAGNGTLALGATAGRQWQAGTSYTTAWMRHAAQQLASWVAGYARDLHRSAMRSALATAGLALAFLLLVVMATVIISRSMVRPLRRLAAAALDVAETQLPAQVSALGGAGSSGPPLPLTPIDVQSSDEIGQVARAVDRIHREAVRLAGDEARMRGSGTAASVSFLRRSSSLLEPLLRLIDSLELDEDDPERLRALFQMDQLATQLRRHADSALVLAGDETPSRWTEPVTLVDLLRAALSEIEQYGRVILDIEPAVSVAASAAVTASAAVDIVHLLAELLENAATFSPATTPVSMSGRTARGGGWLVSITDCGMGMPDEQLRQLNEQLAHPPLADAAVARHMGLFAVAHLAARHGIHVEIMQSPDGGTTAEVHIPAALITRDAGSGDRTGPAGESPWAGTGSAADSVAMAADPLFTAPRFAAGPQPAMESGPPAGAGLRDAVPLLGAPLPQLAPAPSDAIAVPEPAGAEPAGAEPAGLPIFDSVESEYFRAHGDTPAAGRLTSGGLPQRSRQASVAPGTAVDRRAPASVSAHITGSRLASFQQGSRRARAVARTEREAQPAEDD